MRRLALAALMMALFAASAHAKPNDRGDCAIDDKHAWVQLATPPAASAAMHAAADATPNFTVPQHWAAETWFALAGETLLCRSDAPLPEACAGEWWRFDGAGKLAAHDSWICLAR